VNEKILWAEKEFGLGIVIDGKHYISEKIFPQKCKICGKEAETRYVIIDNYGFYLCEDCREVISILSYDLGELEHVRNLINGLRGRETKEM